MIEKGWTLREALVIGHGARLEPGTPIRAWYFGGESEPAKALRAHGEAYKEACLQSDGGCLVLFADAPISMPDNNTLESQLGRFQRLEAIDLARDTPGIVQSLKSKERKLAISVHGNPNVR